jgi:hypothetical protein
MNIEQRLAEAIRSFHLDALSSTVALNIDLDVVLCVFAHTICAALRRRLPGYATATPDTLQRRFLSTSGRILTSDDHITVRLARRAYTPILRQADLPKTTPIPWWATKPSTTSSTNPNHQDQTRVELPNARIGVSPGRETRYGRRFGAMRVVLLRCCPGTPARSTRGRVVRHGGRSR